MFELLFKKRPAFQIYAFSSKLREKISFQHLEWQLKPFFKMFLPNFVLEKYVEIKVLYNYEVYLNGKFFERFLSRPWKLEKSLDN